VSSTVFINATNTKICTEFLNSWIKFNCHVARNLPTGTWC